MTKRIPQPRSELSPGVREHEAKLLAAMLRTSRLTWVFAEPGADKSALLKNGVLPLLQRRRGDRGKLDEVASADGSPAVPRERRRVRKRPQHELAVYFDAWGEAPLTLLKRRILANAGVEPASDPSLAGLLQHTAQQPLQFVFVLDRFEDYLALPPGDAEVGQFAAELVQAIASEATPASFLVALDETARPALERFRSRLPGFDHDVLRLAPVAPVPPAPHLPDSHCQPTLLDVHEETQAPPKSHRPPPRVPIKVEDVYALIESKLTRSRALQQRVEDAPDGVPSPQPRDDRR